MKARNKFKLQDGKKNFDIIQGQNKGEIHIVGKGVNTYLWIGSNVCFGTVSGMKTLETIAASIYRALGHEPMWLHRDKIEALKKRKKK